MPAQQENARGLRSGAEQFPLMVVISIIYPCNFGCPMCPYTDGNSEIRRFYREHHGDLFPVELWRKIADECGEFGAWMRCTGGGEPMSPQMVEMTSMLRAGARAEEHQRQHVRSHVEAAREAGTRRSFWHRPDRVFDGRGGRGDLCKGAPAARRVACEPGRVVEQAGGQRAHRP